MCQIAVFESSQCEKRNPVHQRFDVRNRDGAGDTSKFNLFLLCVQISLQKICKRMSLGRKNDCKRKTTVEDNLGVNNEKLT